MGKDVKSMAGAWEVYDEWRADDRVGFLAEPGGLDRGLKDLKPKPPRVAKGVGGCVFGGLRFRGGPEARHL
jgi:hypothetical protein